MHILFRVQSCAFRETVVSPGTPSTYQHVNGMLTHQSDGFEERKDETAVYKHRHVIAYHWIYQG